MYTSNLTNNATFLLHLDSSMSRKEINKKELRELIHVTNYRLGKPTKIL
jgi:hypothetical protein